MRQKGYWLCVLRRMHDGEELVMASRTEARSVVKTGHRLGYSIWRRQLWDGRYAVRVVGRGR